MSWDGAIEPSKIPQFTGDLEELESDAATLTASATLFRASGALVHSNFQGLSAFYDAPEAEDLFATTRPVATKSDAFADDLEKVATALSDYASEVRPLAAKLERLKKEAVRFCWSEIAGDDDWREDKDKVARNNDLIHDVKTTQVAFWTAEITCHNKITRLIDGTRLHLSDDGKTDCTTYGYTADVLDKAKLPWGAPAEREYTGWNAVWHNVKSFVWDGFVIDGVVGTVKGLGTLVGTEGWEGMKKSWTGLGKLATGLVLTLSPANVAYWMMPEDKLPSWLRDSRRAMTETGKALIAYDQWGKNPARAAGAVAFNVISTVATGGAGAAAKSGAAAKAISAIGKTGRLVDPVTYAIKGGQLAVKGGKYAIDAGKIGAIKVSDLFAGLKNVRGGAYDDILSGAGKLQPDGTVIRIPDRVEVLADGTLKYDTPKGTRYLTADGALRDAQGEVLVKRVDQVRIGGSAAGHPGAHSDVTSPRDAGREPALVGAGGRTGDGVAGAAGRVGDGVGGAGRGASGSADGAMHQPSASHSSGDGSSSRGAGSSAQTHDAASAGHGGATPGGSGHDASSMQPHGTSASGGGPSIPTRGTPYANLDPTIVDGHIRRLDELQGGEGHAPGRHLYPDDDVLRDRLGTVLTDRNGAPKVYGPDSPYTGLLKSENNIDPLTGTTVDGISGRAHRVGPFATRFDNAEDMVVADTYFRSEIARTGSPPAEVPIDRILGDEGHKQFTGYYRDPADASQFRPVDFEGGTIKPVYRQVDGSWKLITMYPNPAAGRYP
ncbi:hypothetical protein [Streptomyces alboflavus]|uniref:hypothetical protein n=1 Tax=Streptomyces alboflavus TaxID=67267 RepID=UPI000F657EEA|nr:hypothetical protein [Streptomyces alboflavus]